MRRVTVLTLVMVALTTPPGVRAQTGEAMLGTWALNVAKSTYNPGPAPYVRATCTIDRTGDRVRMVYDMVRVRGGVTHLEWIGALDGRDYPVHGLDEVVTNAYRQIDERTFEMVVKVDGRTTATARTVISPDGRTMTTETLGANPQGQRVVWITVYEKR